MKTHFTTDEKVTYTSIPWCQGNPQPRWKITNVPGDVTCDRCTTIARIS